MNKLKYSSTFSVGFFLVAVAETISMSFNSNNECYRDNASARDMKKNASIWEKSKRLSISGACLI